MNAREVPEPILNSPFAEPEAYWRISEHDDRIHKHRGINRCVDLSATPYYLGRVGQDANRPFPWVVSDFGLVDARGRNLAFAASTEVSRLGLAIGDTTLRLPAPAVAPA